MPHNDAIDPRLFSVRKHKQRAQALSNEEIWAKLLETCADIVPWVAKWCDHDEGLAWFAMFRTACMWKPNRRASFRSYVRSWARHEAWRLHCGGGGKKTGEVQRSYAILTNAKRSFARCHNGSTEELTMEAAIAAPEREEAFGFDEKESLRDAIARLPSRERTVIEGRFYRGQTLDVVGTQLGVGYERVRQLETRAKERLGAMLSVRMRAS